MNPCLTWDENEQCIVHSVSELDQMIEKLTAKAKEENMPFTVELQVDPETALVIVVGREESHVAFYSTASRPPIVTSIGPWDEDEQIVFTHRGHWSSMDKRFWVPIAEAREAMRSYFLTGRRPDNITW